MNKILKNISGSFNNIQGDGWAARKLTAFAFVVLVFYIHYRYIDKTNAIDAIIIDCLSILLLLGLVTFEQIILFKNGKEKQSE